MKSLRSHPRFAALLVLALAAVLAVGWLTATQTLGFGGYKTAFNNKYGTAGTRLDSCNVCHNADFTRNPYGEDFEAQPTRDDAAFTAIEGEDSDGDSFTNIAEITARSFPGDASDTPGPTPTPPAVRSVPVDTAPVIDGDPDDAVWDQATVVDIPVAGGANLGASHGTTVKIQSVYTADRVYFLLHYADPTMSLQRLPWQKQADGSWLKLSTSTTHQENTYYEDKWSFIWDMGIDGFDQAGCAMTCHTEPGESAYGSMYTENAGELGDIWHWKAVRTDPVNQVDDQYLDSNRPPGEAGRHGDPKTGGGYSNNQNAENTAPAFTDADQPAPPYWILDANKQPFVDTYSAGDEIAGIIDAPFAGDRGDIEGKGTYSGGQWYVEFSRLLTTGSANDIQFDDLSDTYHFGVAVFDNAQVNHATQSGVTAFEFAPAGEERLWGDFDCMNNITIGDAQKIARNLVGLEVSQGEGCPAPRAEVSVDGTTRLWGDLDCMNGVTIGDAQKTARDLIGLPITQAAGCPEPGDTVVVSIP